MRDLTHKNNPILISNRRLMFIKQYTVTDLSLIKKLSSSWTESSGNSSRGGSSTVHTSSTWFIFPFF